MVAPPAVFAAVVLRTAELSALWRVFAGASPAWLVAAALLAAAFAVDQGALYAGVFDVLGVEVGLADAVVLSLVMAFASLALPAGTASGIAYFVSAASERGIPPSRALLGGIAYYLFDYGVLIPVLVAGMVVLHVHQDLGAASVAAAGVISVAALAAAGAMAWGLLRPQQVVRALQAAGTRVTRALRWTRRGPQPAAVAELAGEVREILTAMRARLGRSTRPFLHAVLLQAIAIGLLRVVFAALGFAVALGVLVAGYTVGTVFMVVSITPSGAGVVEGAMTVTFTSLGVPLEVAAAATVLFRLYTFWLPMLAGFLTLRLWRPAAA
jgi:uncharacterized protein (TIRG00374 family)